MSVEPFNLKAGFCLEMPQEEIQRFIDKRTQLIYQKKLLF